jgi:hypothetical protein
MGNDESGIVVLLLLLLLLLLDKENISGVSDKPKSINKRTKEVNDVRGPQSHTSWANVVKSRPLASTRKPLLRTNKR